MLATLLIGCSGPNASDVLEQALKAMEDNPRFEVVVGWIGAGGEAVFRGGPEYQFVLPDKIFCRQGPGYETIPFIKVIGNHTYTSEDGVYWKEEETESGALYFLRWNPYEFLDHAGNPVDGGTATVNGRRCRVIEADVALDDWGNGTGWVTDRTSVGLVVYADTENFLPYRIIVQWREEYPQGITEFPYVIDISYDETIAIEPPAEVMTEAEMEAVAESLNPVIEERAQELVRILSSFKEENGVFPDRLDLETVGDVMQAAGLEWPANPVTGAPMADDEFMLGNFFYISMENGGDYQLDVCVVYTSHSGGELTYYGLPERPTIIPWLTDEQKERALEIALADPRVQELLKGRQYDVGDIAPNHMGSKLIAAMVNIDLREPCIIEYDWPFPIYNVDGSIDKGIRHSSAGVETLWITVSLEEEMVVGIEPLSFQVFR